MAMDRRGASGFPGGRRRADCRAGRSREGDERFVGRERDRAGREGDEGKKKRRRGRGGAGRAGEPHARSS